MQTIQTTIDSENRSNILHGKSAFITGGSKGIGYGVAQTLVAAGMHVAISARTQKDVEEAVVTLKSHTKQETQQVLGVVYDVRDLAAQKAAVQDVLAAFGTLDALVANAGVGAFAPIDELEPDDWHKVIDTNLTGVFYSVKACLEAIKQAKGYIITISSLAGKNFFERGSAYNASKFGVTGFTEAIMLDLRKYDVKVSTIMPGSVATYFNHHQPNTSDDWKIQIEDIGELVYDLLVMNPRTLPSRIEVRPSRPPSAN